MSLRMIRFLTAGESHGKTLMTILEGFPAGLRLDEGFIAAQMARRQKGYGRGGRMQIETDYTEILSGVRHGLTLGSPITLQIVNKDWVNWQEAMSIAPIDPPTPPITRLRPGHADLAGTMKYRQSDVRNILERASARETAARVAAGAVARRFLDQFGIQIYSHVLCIGGVWSSHRSGDTVDWGAVETSPVRCADADVGLLMIKSIDSAKEAGDTVGGVIEVVVTGLPIGLGSHVHWDRRLDGRLAQALMSINAVKATSIGDGWESVDLRGSQVHDVIEPVSDPENPWQRHTNRGGGTEGGTSNGMPLVARFAVKPISTLSNPLPSVDLITGELVQAHYERSDVCQVPAAGVIGEAMVGLILADTLLEKFGGDHIDETISNYRAYQKTVQPRANLESEI